MAAARKQAVVGSTDDSDDVVEVMALTMTAYTDADGNRAQAFPGNTLRVTKREAGRLHGGHLVGVYSDIAGTKAPAVTHSESSGELYTPVKGLDNSDPDEVEMLDE